MKFFKSATEKLSTKEVEYKLHEKVIKDLTEGNEDLGIWGKALVDADGDEKKAKAIYISLMVQHYKDTAKSGAELEAISSENFKKENLKKQESEKNNKILLEKQKKDKEILIEKQKNFDKWNTEQKKMIQEGKNWTGDDVFFVIMLSLLIAPILFALLYYGFSG